MLPVARTRRYEPQLKNVPMFRKVPRRFIEALVTHFKPQVYLHGDYLIRERDLARDVYLLQTGEVSCARFGSGFSAAKSLIK